MSRLAPPLGALEFIELDRPFSNFKFLDDRYGSPPFPLRRLFSQARSRLCRVLVLEQVAPMAAVLHEVEELRTLASDYELGGLERLSFWKTEITNEAELAAADPNDCIGYAILKYDVCPSRDTDSWHVFESVIRKHDHKHNYTPCDTAVSFRVGSRELAAPGVLYGQQNGLNKACAQVGLRSICANYLRDSDLTYLRINELAFAGDKSPEPGLGLTTAQTARVLDGLGIKHTRLSYGGEKDIGKHFPYQRAVYSGIESGCGSLLVFSLPDNRPNREPNMMHMIACFGHTFNEDTWAPTAEVDYFGADSIRYTPSDAWMSSFLVHDDNFGPNLCIPKAFLKPELVRHAFVLLPAGFAYEGFIAEMIAANFLYSIVEHLADSKNEWYLRLVEAARIRKLILRVVPITKTAYLANLRKLDDWDFHQEREETLVEIERVIQPSLMWMIEVSFPDLFPTNKRKVGEVLLDASVPLPDELTFGMFVLARFPGAYVLLERAEGEKGGPQFLSVPSDLLSHTEVLSR